MRRFAATSILLLAIGEAGAKVTTETIRYQQDKTVLVGFLAYDDAVAGRRPGVLVIGEWWGLNDFAREQARRLAELGYVAFAADLYGDGFVTQDPAEAGRRAGELRGDPDLLRARARAGYDVLAAHGRVAPEKIAAIGFCFGGTAVLQLAYSGAAVAGVVSFHGGLVPPTAEDRKRIQAKVLILHGAADTHVPVESVQGVQRGLEEADADWQMVIYSGAKHSFTNPESDRFNMPGVGYDQKAAERSWRQMQLFFDELFRPQPYADDKSK